MEAKMMTFNEALWLVWSGFTIGVCLTLLILDLTVGLDLPKGVGWAVVLPLVTIQFSWRKFLPETDDDS